MAVRKKTTETKKKARKKTSAPALGKSLIADIVSGIRSSVGNEYAQFLGAEENLLKIKGVISTRIPGVDAAIGRGGFPLGRLSILHGGEGSGKTTLALQLCAECQRRGGAAVYIDKEYKLDPDYAVKLGVDIDALGLSQPNTLEQVIETIAATAETVKRYRLAGRIEPTIIVLDSLNASQSEDTISGETGKRQYPNEARVWSQELPEVIKLCSKETIALVFISQIRRKINVMYGNDVTTAGGESPKFHASVIAFLRHIQAMKDTEKNRIANLVEVEFKKNQIAPPFRKAQFVLRYGEGADYYDSLVRVAIERGWIKTTGKKFSFDRKVFTKQGRSAAIEYVRTHKAMRVELKKRTRSLWDGTRKEDHEPDVASTALESVA